MALRKVIHLNGSPQIQTYRTTSANTNIMQPIIPRELQKTYYYSELDLRDLRLPPPPPREGKELAELDTRNI